jgi:hypothetical protein
MATKGFIVSFQSLPGDSATVVDRVRNWAEDLWREVHDHGWGVVENPDTATDAVTVTVAGGRSLGAVAAAIRRSLRRHNLLGAALITKASGGVRRRTSGCRS